MLSSNSQNLGYLSLWSTLGLKACTFVLSRVQSLNTFGDYIKFRGQFTDCWFIPIFFVVYLLVFEKSLLEPRLYLNFLSSQHCPWIPDPPASASQILALQACTTYTQHHIFFYLFDNPSPEIFSTKVSVLFYTTLRNRKMAYGCCFY